MFQLGFFIQGSKETVLTLKYAYLLHLFQWKVAQVFISGNPLQIMCFNRGHDDNNLRLLGNVNKTKQNPKDTDKQMSKVGI